MPRYGVAPDQWTYLSMTRLYAHIPAPDAAKTLFQQFEKQKFPIKDNVLTLRIILAFTTTQSDDRVKYATLLSRYGFGSSPWSSLLVASLAMDENEYQMEASFTLKNVLVSMHPPMDPVMEDQIMRGLHLLTFALGRERENYHGESSNWKFDDEHSYDRFLNGLQRDVYLVMITKSQRSRAIFTNKFVPYSPEWSLWRRIFAQNPVLAARFITNQMYYSVHPMCPVHRQRLRLLFWELLTYSEVEMPSVDKKAGEMISLSDDETFRAMIAIGYQVGGVAIVQHILCRSLLSTKIQFCSLLRDIRELDAMICLSHSLGMHNDSRWIEELYQRDRTITSFGKLAMRAVGAYKERRKILWIAMLGLDLGCVSLGMTGKIEKCSKV